MLKRALGAMLGIMGALLWFTPLGYVGGSGFGLDLYQTGEHLGGITYVLLLSCALCTLFAWTSSPVPYLMSAVVSCLICGLLVLAYRERAAWGLVGLCSVAVASLGLAIHALRSRPSKVTGQFNNQEKKL